MTGEPEEPHVEHVSKISFRAGERLIHIVADEPPGEPDMPGPLPKLGPGPVPPIRIQLRLGYAGAGSELNLDEYIERATAENRDMIIHIRRSET
jgi:hypothetical protein